MDGRGMLARSPHGFTLRLDGQGIKRGGSKRVGLLCSRPQAGSGSRMDAVQIPWRLGWSGKARAASRVKPLELDYPVDLAAASRIVGPDRVLWGNLDPVGLLSQGTPDQVREQTGRLVRSLSAAGHRRFVLSSGWTSALENARPEPARDV